MSRLPVALRLAAEGPSVLVVSSAPGTANAPARALCNNPGSLIVYCFAPTPENTRGEARGIGQLVAEQGWARITVVTSTLHIARASVLIRRCTDAEVEMADAKVPLPVGAWADSVLHEVGGLAESVLRPDC